MRQTVPYTCSLSLVCLLCSVISYAQFTVPATSTWAETKQKGEGNIALLWYDIEPFIYRDGKGGIRGVEYELMEGFKGFVKQKYGVQLNTAWVDAGSFEAIYPYTKMSQAKGLFGLSFYSITDERKKEVKFSPPYMPDLNIVVTNNQLPSYQSDEAFIKDLSKMKGYTMKQTTMEEDLVKLKKAHFPSLPISDEGDDYEVLKQIATYQNAFGYVPVSIYVVALQRGIKIKRQRVLATRREGFAAIYTKESDWEEPVNAYFNSPECRMLVDGLIRKYLGAEVAEIILNVSASDTLSGKPSDIELLTKEREIVTQRLIDTALEAERSKTQRNIFLLVGGAVLLIAGITYSRFHTKNHLSKILQHQNDIISEQKKKVEELNQLLNMKILQSKLNPHFLFNSLNAIQYHIGTDDKRGALNYIARFSAFLRKVLQSSDEILISVATEATLAEQYLWLEEARFPERFTYRITLEEEAKNFTTPPLLVHSILQETLYTNILNSQQPESLYLNLFFSKEEENLLIRIRDNGIAGTEGKALLQKNEAANDSILKQRLQAINLSAVQPVQIQYTRVSNENIVEVRLPQPLFHT